MKKTMRIVAALSLIAGLSACAVAPYPAYVEPGVAVVVPPPVYAPPPYVGFGFEYRSYGGHRRW